MTTYTGYTASNKVQVVDRDTVVAHLEEHQDHTNLQDEWTNGTLQLFNTQRPAFVKEPVCDEFWTRLGELIEEVLVVRSVGYKHHQPMPDTQQWVVTPDAEWTHESLPDRHLEDEGAAEDRTPEEIAEEHDQLIEFGELVAQLREAADTLEKNGHTTVGVFETLDEAEDLLNTVAAEEQAQAKRRQREIERLMAEEDLSLEEALEEVD